jgi:hypothetical protein
MQWIIDELQIQLDFFKYKIIHGSSMTLADAKQKPMTWKLPSKNLRNEIR